MKSDPASNQWTRSLQRANAEMSELVLLSEVILGECRATLGEYRKDFGSKKEAAA